MTDFMQHEEELTSSFNEEADDSNIDVELINYPPDEMLQIKEVLIKDKVVRDMECERKKKIDQAFEESMLSYKLNDVGSEDTHCPLCSEKFSLFMNQKKICSFCEKGFCGKCLYKFYHNSVQICQVCFLISVRDGKSGFWFNSQSETNGRLRRSASVIIMTSIRRIKSKFTTTLNPERQSFQQPSSTNELSINESRPPLNRPISPRIPPRPNVELKNQQSPRKISNIVDGGINQSLLTNNLVQPDLAIATEARAREDSVSPNNKLQSNTGGMPQSIRDVRDDPTRLQANTLSNLNKMSSLSTSAMSVYSDVEDSYKTGIPVSGEIYFFTHFDEARKLLSIYVDQCRNIAVADRKHRKTDPYIKTYLLPDKTKMSKRKSTLKKITQNPVFKETLSYGLSREDLELRTLSISVWHKSTLLKYNIFLGEVQLVLSEANLTSKECQWHSLGERRRTPLRAGGTISKGDLIIKLKYKHSNIKDGKGSLHVIIDGARNLEHDRTSLNAYVKGYLLPDKNAKSKKKTGLCKGTLNPTWNSPMIFSDVTLKELRDRSLELSVNHQNLLKGNEFLGGVRLNLGLGLHSIEHVQWMDAQGAEKETWERLLSNQSDTLEATLPLRPNLDF